ncbi:hypothetical protein BD626DRAFT_99688 [Schizophyllum amplum]|uniref:Uncharacterized protein n=1 Tax=Schizophyllum amplum TaxID=97359 RepID=A0A550CRC4_9AGAR|nr:hypothetical protein BD626DRAFT_99688 [Auriculariopsis ampla]
MDFDRCLAPIPPFVGPRTWVPPIGAHVRGRATTTTRLLTTDTTSPSMTSMTSLADLHEHNPDRHDLPRHRSGVRRDGERDDDGDGTAAKGTTTTATARLAATGTTSGKASEGGGMMEGRTRWEGLLYSSRACRPLPACSVATSAGLRGCAGTGRLKG